MSEQVVPILVKKHSGLVQTFSVVLVYGQKAWTEGYGVGGVRKLPRCSLEHHVTCLDQF